MPERRSTMSDEQYRELCRVEKRKQRARRYAAGLNAAGHQYASRRAAASAATQRVFAPHPGGCPCYDCLFPRPDPAAAVLLESIAWAAHRTVRA